MKSVNNEHSKMVVDLCKAGEDIIAGLSPQTIHLFHMGVGILGETVEFGEGLFRNDETNMKEELGDLEFFLKGIQQKLVGEVDYANVPAKNTDAYTLFPLLLKNAEICADITKKWAIYAKEINDETTSKLYIAITEIYSILKTVYTEFGYTREDILEQNMFKLRDSENARYSAGTYEDSAAQYRADKQ